MRVVTLCVLALGMSAPSMVARETGAAPAGKALSATGMILRRPPGSADWRVARQNDGLLSEQMLVGLPGAELASANDAVHLKFLTDFDAPLPVLESAVILHPAGKRDLDLTLDRGIGDLVSHKRKGTAEVHLHVRDAEFDVTLYTAGTHVTLLRGGAWPKGVPFTRKPGPTDVPVAQLIVLVHKGEVDVRQMGKLYALEAPPGPAQIAWDSVGGLDATPTRLEALPEWILPPKSLAEQEKTRKLDAIVKEFSAELAKGAATHPTGDLPFDEAALKRLLTSDDPARRLFGLVVSGAIDELSNIRDVLETARDLATWDAAVRVLRQWIGRAPGHDQILYERLIKLRGYKPAESEAVLQFLHTPDDTEASRPETYEMLIDYLQSEKLAIRGLAFWHLNRLVPQGRSIAYDPLGPDAKRAEARAKWKKLIPDGKLPPPSEKKDEK